MPPSNQTPLPSALPRLDRARDSLPVRFRFLLQAELEMLQTKLEEQRLQRRTEVAREADERVKADLEEAERKRLEAVEQVQWAEAAASASEARVRETQQHLEAAEVRARAADVAREAAEATGVEAGRQRELAERQREEACHRAAQAEALASQVKALEAKLDEVRRALG